MTAKERVEQLERALSETGILELDDHLKFVILLCNGCSKTESVGNPFGPTVSFQELVSLLEEHSVGWQLGGLNEEADFCPDCVAKRG